MGMGAMKKARVGLSGRPSMKPRNLEPLLLTLALCCTTLIAGCAGIVTASGPTNPTNGAFQVSPSTVSFGTVVVGKKGTQSVTVTNPGTTSVTRTAVAGFVPRFVTVKV